MKNVVLPSARVVGELAAAMADLGVEGVLCCLFFGFGFEGLSHFSFLISHKGVFLAPLGKKAMYRCMCFEGLSTPGFTGVKLAEDAGDS